MSGSNSNQETGNGQLGHRSKCLLIINAILLSKTTSNKTCLVALNTTIDSDLDSINPLIDGRSNTRQKWNKIPCMHALRIEFLCHSLLLLGMFHSLTIRLRLRVRVNSNKEGLEIGRVDRGGRKCVPIRRTPKTVWVMMGDNRSIFRRGWVNGD